MFQSSLTLPLADDETVLKIVLDEASSLLKGLIVTLTILTGGLTNKVLKLKASNDAGEKIRLWTIRIFGKDSSLLVNRSRERAIAAFLVQHEGRASPLVGVFANAHVYEFVQGRELQITELRDSRIQQMIAREMALWHALGESAASDDPRRTSTDVVEAIGGSSRYMFEDADIWIDYVHKNIDESRRKEYHWDALLRGWHRIEEMLLANDNDDEERRQRKRSRLVTLCHNDLVAGNMLVDEVDQRIRFIDYEYSFVNFRAFDLANFFNEWSWDGAAFSQALPSREEQRRFLLLYVSEFSKSRANSLSEVKQELLISQLLDEAHIFSAASDFYWSIWSLIQSQASSLSFDYFQYGAYRRDRALQSIQKK